MNEFGRFLIFVPAAVLLVALAAWLLFGLIMDRPAPDPVGRKFARVDVDAKYAELCRKEGAA